MKTTITLFIVAVVFLCSCKGSSFLNQRYTHFSHAGSKKISHPVAARNSASHSQQQEVKAPVTEESLVALVAAEPIAQSALAPAVTLQEHSKISGLKKVSDVLTAPVKAAKARAGFQKKDQSASVAQQHRGLLSGLVGLILYIVISAVIIALIIILVLALI